MRRLLGILLKSICSAILLAWLVVGVFGRSRDIVYGYGKSLLFPPLDNLVYLTILPLGISIAWIMLSFRGRFIHLKLLLSACLLLCFGFALPEAAALLHPLARPEFRENLDAACMNMPVPQAKPYAHGRAGPNRIAPAGELLPIYTQMPETWTARSMDEMQLVLCSEGRQELVIAEYIYDVPYLPDGLLARRVQYIERFRLVAADTGQTISSYTGYGDYPPEFPEVLRPPVEFFHKPDQILVFYGEKNTRYWLLYWLYRYIYPGQRTPNSIF
jgi:hypothetical protein